MLERVTIAKSDLNLGELSEAIIYYGHVDHVLNRGSAVELIRTLGIDGAIRLASSPYVSLIYNRSFPAIWSDPSRLYPYQFQTLHISKTADGVSLGTPHKDLEEAVRATLGRGTIPKSKLEAFCNQLSMRESPPSLIGSGALDDLKDPRFLNSGIKAVVRAIIPEYGNIDRFTFEIMTDGDRFSLFTDMDFEEANRFYHTRIPESHSSITRDFILAHFATMRFEMFYSGGSNADLWTDEAHSALLRARVNSFATRLNRGRERIDRFQEVIFPARNFSAAVNSGERTLLELLDFAETNKTLKFKKWLANAPQNADLLREYDKAQLQPSRFAQSLPMKAGKIVLFSGAGMILDAALGGTGLIGAASGVAGEFVLSAADEMLFSKLNIGWKPNQWVSNSARPFLES